ncbi:MAG TPA: hypothetical protein VNO82_14275 [Solirubrobacteraceae bacterium]|nr:hypothetical protein [Solirubrobacteraceae bacterium]
MRLAAICATALVIGGCGADDAANEIRDTVDPVAEAADKMADAGGARVDGDMTVTSGKLEFAMRMDGAVSFEDHEAQFVMDYADNPIPGATAKDLEAARREADFPVRMVQSTEETYVSTPSVVREGREDGIRWLKIDHEKVDEEGGLDFSGVNQMSEINPNAMLRFLRTVADARETGTRRIDGTPTTRYTASVDLRDYPETVEPDKREAAQRTVDALIEIWGSPTHRVHVWIDEDGLIRREEMTFSFTEAGEKSDARLVLDFLDVGTPQEIALPDGDEAYDISDEVAEQLGED